MPLYRFNVHDSTNFSDAEGTELPNLASARTEAVKLAGSLIRDNVENFWDKDNEWHMDVTNDVGLTLFRLTFIAIDAPAVRALEVGD